MKGKSTTIRGSYSGGGVSSGVADGLSSAASLDTENIHDLKINNQGSAAPGFTRQCIKKRAGKSVKSKGNNFDMC